MSEIIDVDVLMNKANSIINSLNDDISDFVDYVNRKAKQEKINRIPKGIKPNIVKGQIESYGCPTVENVSVMTEKQRKEAIFATEKAIQDINKEPFKFGDLQEDTRGEDRGSKGAGGDEDVIELLYLQQPEWFKELKTFCVSYKRKKGREYFDAEMLARGRLSKQKLKTKTKSEDLYIILDVSGSMWSLTDHNGIPFIQLMASFIPLFAKRYAGFWVQSDAKTVTGEFAKPIYSLKELGKQFKKAVNGGGSLSLGGKSGADYITDIIVCQQHSERYYNTKEPTIVLFSDGAETFPNPMPINLCLILPKNKKQAALSAIDDKSFPNEKKNQKIILMEVDVDWNF